MVLQVVVDERLDEVVAVVVPRVAAQREGLANLRARDLEQMGVQLPFQKLVRQALVDEDAARVGGQGLVFHQHGGIVLTPAGAVCTQVAGERLLAPGALGGRADGRKGREGFEPPRVAQGQGERAVPAHRVAKNAQALPVDRQRARAQRQQLVHQVAFHAPVRGPGGLGGVQVKACAHAKVPALGFAGHVGAARAGVGRDERQAQFGCAALGAGLGSEGLFGAGQPGQVQQGRDRALAGLGRQVHRKFHRQADGARIMAVEALLAAKAGMAAQQFQMGGHGLLTKE